MISLPLSGVERVCNIPQDATLRATTQPVSVREQNNTAGLRTAIFPTQPNPASDRTTLRFVLAEPSTVTLRVYSALGIEVQTIAARQYEKGEHLVEFDTANLPQGVYFCTLQTPKQSLTQTLTILH
jgi:serine protease AprX